MNEREYIISALVPQPAGGNVRNTIETDDKVRAIHLANVFVKNGWREVRIEVRGQLFYIPFGDLP